VDIQKQYWGPPKGSKHALTLGQRLYKIKFDDGSLQTVLAEDTIESEAVVVDTLSVYQKVIRRWREEKGHLIILARALVYI
jgi:hypothetical protein